MKLVQSSQTLSNPHKPLSLSGGIFPSSFKQAFVQPLLNPSISTYPLIHLYPLLISATSVQFQTSLSFSKCSKKSLPPTFDLTCPLTLCLFLNLLTGSFILLKLFFLKFPMTSTLECIVVRSLAFFLTYLQPSILLILQTRLHRWFGFDGLSLNSLTL